jgi:hypothetical protein
VTPPLILTLQLDEPSERFYEDLRRHFFPPARNVIPAHLSLFHQLPEEERTHQALREAAGATSAFPLTHASLRSIGRGVAVFFQSDRLASLHARLSADFSAHLIPQDRQPFRPHIVVQNKVTPETARLTLAQLDPASLVEPHGIGLTLWRYLGGPWEHLSNFPFAG